MFRSLQTYAKVALAGFALIAFFHVLGIVLGLLAMLDPESFRQLYSDESATRPLLLFQGSVAMLVGLAMIVVFLMWLYRAHSNLPFLQAKDLEFTSGWAVGWWFIPIASLFKPFQVVREVWVESDPETVDDVVFLSYGPRSAPTYMVFWWVFWLISNISANLIGLIVTQTQDLVVLGGIDVFVSVVTLAATGLVMYLVRDITDRQEKRSASVTEIASNLTLPPPPPTF
jgi:hypothetical protein